MFQPLFCFQNKSLLCGCSQEPLAKASTGAEPCFNGPCDTGKCLRAIGGKIALPPRDFCANNRLCYLKASNWPLIVTGVMAGVRTLDNTLVRGLRFRYQTEERPKPEPRAPGQHFMIMLICWMRAPKRYSNLGRAPCRSQHPPFAGL